MDKQLQLCRDLFGAVLSCQEACKVPSSFNSSLLDVLQLLMLEAVGLLQEEQVRDVRRCLEAVLQLLSRVSCLGPIEAFFTSDDLLAHYQRHLDAAAALTSKLQGQRQQQQVRGFAAGAASSSPATAAAGGQMQNNNSCCGCLLQLPEQQLRVVRSFRQQATLLCPRLVGSCPPDVLQQLCETVREGLVLVNGHSFLLGEEWQVEVSAMLGRAEQLKVLLAHRQAHHISLLAAMLQLLHRQEVQEYELPYWPSQSPLPQQLLQERPECASPTAILTASSQQHVLFSDHAVTEKAAAAAAAGAAGKGLADKAGQLPRSRMCSPAPQQAHVIVAAGLELNMAAGVLGQQDGDDDDDDDEFYMPVAPLPVLSSAPSTPTAAAGLAAGASCLPFELATTETYTGSIDLSDGSFARLPSSGCSSLLEYVNNMPSGPGGTGLQPAGAAVADEVTQYGSSSSGSGQQQLRRITEEQLQSIAGPEAAPMLAAALGVVLESWCEGSRGSYASSNCSSSNRSLLDSSTTAAAAAAGSALNRAGGSGGMGNQLGGPIGEFRAAIGRQTGDGGESGWGVDAASRQLSELAVGSTAGSTTSFLSGGGSRAGSFVSSCGGSRAGSPSLLLRQQQQQRQRQRPLSGGSNRSSPATAAAAVATTACDSPGSGRASCDGSSKRRSRTRHKQQQKLCLQHTLLPAGCCRSIGAVLYLSPHITRLVLVDVGLDDHAVGDLVDALKVNSSVVLLDISRNKVEDIGARALAGLLKQRSSSSSQLRALYLQHNEIGDDGAAALASSLASNSQLQRLWLQHNSIGAAGALALARAMQHNTSCTSLKLLAGNCGVPKELGHMAQKMAWHNRGMRDRIKRLLQHVLTPKNKDS